MARKIIGSQNITDTTDAIQFISGTSVPAVMAITIKARSGNAGAVYIGEDSAAKSSGYELLAGDVENWVFEPVTVKADKFYVWGNSSGDRLDFIVVREN